MGGWGCLYLCNFPTQFNCMFTGHKQYRKQMWITKILILISQTTAKNIHATATTTDVGQQTRAKPCRAPQNMNNKHCASFENRMCVLQGEPGEPGRSGIKVKKSPVDADETLSVWKQGLWCISSRMEPLWPTQCRVQCEHASCLPRWTNCECWAQLSTSYIVDLPLLQFAVCFCRRVSDTTQTDWKRWFYLPALASRHPQC